MERNLRSQEVWRLAKASYFLRFLSEPDCSGNVSLDNVMFGFYRFVLAVLIALTTTRGSLFNNNAQSLELP
jgi:hypothetical protein